MAGPMRKPSWFVDINVEKHSGEFNVTGKFESREIKRSGHYGQYWEGGFQARDVPKPRTGEYFEGAYQAPSSSLVDLDPYGNYYFALEISDSGGKNGTEIAHFMECSGLKTASAVFEIEEGGMNGRTYKRPGVSKWENIVLKYATSASTFLLAWRDNWLTNTDNWKKRTTYSGAITLKSNKGGENDVIKRYEFKNAWPVSWEGPAFNSGGSELAIETLEIAHDGLRISNE